MAGRQKPSLTRSGTAADQFTSYRRASRGVCVCVRAGGWVSPLGVYHCSPLA